MTPRYDIAIVGAGMAGASVAAALDGRARVVLLEGEDRPGYHTTGRSAAFWTESYGGPGIQPLTSASGPHLHAGGFLSPRAALTIGREEQEPQVRRFANTFAALGVAVDLLDRDGLEARIPGLRPGWTLGALEPSCCDIDVAGLHQHYLAAAGRSGADLRVRARVTALRRRTSGWQLELASGQALDATVIVNAAGAWADPVAAMAGLRPIGIAPYRRTVAQVRMERPVPSDLPLVLDVAERFYFKPEGNGLWLSPHDETPSVPCDAAPEELDIATAIERLESVVDWPVARIEHRWAGLRSFAPDRLPVIGFDPRAPGFFWLAGQGGFGIQTAPAVARMAAGLLLETDTGPVDPAPFDPGRLV